MERTQVWLRLVCFGFGMVVGILLPDKAGRRFFPHPDAPGAQLVRLMLGVTKTVVGCAVAVVAAPLPVAVSILYTGLGVYAAQTAMQPRPERQTLPIICTWLILFLPFTGALACLGGGLLVLAADVPGLAGLAILVLAAPMALLQFGAEGCLVLLGAAALLCARQMMPQRTRSGVSRHPG